MRLKLLLDTSQHIFNLHSFWKLLLTMFTPLAVDREIFFEPFSAEKPAWSLFLYFIDILSTTVSRLSLEQ